MTKQKKAREWFKWMVEIEVHDTWVRDGLDLTSERMHEIMLSAIGWAYSEEIRTRTVKAPPEDDVRWAQGYPVAGRETRVE